MGGGGGSLHPNIMLAIRDTGSMNGTTINNFGVLSVPMTIRHGSVLRFGKEGISNGVALKCILAKVNLHYPKEKVEDMEEDHKGMMDKPQDTANLEGIVDFLEQTANRSPKSSAMLNRFERALENKSLFDLTDQEAVALEPGLLNFPDSHQP